MYLQKRPYRKKQLHTKEGAAVIELMENRFQSPFENYWEQFGYEIGGPVCYGFTKWLVNEIDSDIDQIAFVGRDGWILIQIYKMLAGETAKPSLYVYAPRSMLLSVNSDEYARYLSDAGINGGKTAVVDTITMKFSSQRLISIGGLTIGYYWGVLANIRGFNQGFQYKSFQHEDRLTIKCWNLMEFIMTSPEPPIKALENGRPVYRDVTQAETMREKLFPFIEKGVLEFVTDAINKDDFSFLSNKFITRWVNSFLKYPDETDIEKFEPICISERSDHADSIPLDPFKKLDKTQDMDQVILDRLWYWSQQHPTIYSLLHWGKYKLRMQNGSLIRTNIFTGKNIKKVMDIIQKCDVVSFDIFDTLLLRPYGRPTDLFFDMEKEYCLFDFHDNRIEAEKHARNTSSCSEINLNEIYAILSQLYGIDAETLVQREINWEKKICYANPDFHMLYREIVKSGKTLIATSDMYLSSTVLKELLENNGYSGIEKLFISNEYGCSKSDGSLQSAVWNEIGRDKKVLHIGDNYHSDVTMGVRTGWTCIWYKRKYSGKVLLMNRTSINEISSTLFHHK